MREKYPDRTVKRRWGEHPEDETIRRAALHFDAAILTLVSCMNERESRKYKCIVTAAQRGIGQTCIALSISHVLLMIHDATRTGSIEPTRSDRVNQLVKKTHPEIPT